MTAGILIPLIAAGCEILQPEEAGDLRELTVSENRLVESGNSFGFNLFQAIHMEEEQLGNNAFISPLSVSIALAMTLNGANGDTRAAMEEALELTGMSKPEINQSYQSLIELLIHLDPEVAVQIANSIWVRQGFPVEDEFVDVNETNFDALVSELDFSADDAADIMNSWIYENTNGLIDDVVDSPIPANVVMYLINAIYFNGMWTYNFDEEDTRDEPFFAADGTEPAVPMMRVRSDFSAAISEDVQIVDLPYGDKRYSMTIVVPHGDQTVEDLIQQLDDATWNAWMASLEEKEIQVIMPRFSVEYEHSLIEALDRLGMGIAFDWEADFTGINPDGGLLISDVIHSTYVDVNEEGTEAAAVTVVEIERVSVPSFPTLRADRPFLFFIREQHSGTILFMGKMLDPS